MTVSVATLGCDRKASEGFPSWRTLFQLQGDYSLYFNYEAGSFEGIEVARYAVEKALGDNSPMACSKWSLDTWGWRTSYGADWRSLPKFDQDQARLASIVTARNMCIEYAMQTGADQLLFVDSDIIPPLDIIPKMLEVMDAGEEAVCGLVNGRGVHKTCQYVFGSKGFETIANVQCQRVEHANIGFTMLSKRLFNQIRFRYGFTEYPDGRKHTVSDDPAYHLDAFIKFGKWPVIRMDVVGAHIGDLQSNETSQY